MYVILPGRKMCSRHPSQERSRPMHPFRSPIETGETDRVLELFSPEVVFDSPEMGVKALA